MIVPEFADHMTMASFVFRLETVLKLRLSERDERRAVLAKTLREAELVQQELDALAAELQTLARQNAARPGAVDVLRLAHAAVYAATLRDDQQAAERRRAELAPRIARERDALLAADREVRTLEKLRERQRAEFDAALRKRDQRKLDEMAAQGAPSQGDS